jgi:hypothetical protein
MLDISVLNTSFSTFRAVVGALSDMASKYFWRLLLNASFAPLVDKLGLQKW